MKYRWAGVVLAVHNDIAVGDIHGNKRVLHTNTSNGSIYGMDSNGCNKSPLIGDFNFLGGGEG